MIQRPGAIPAPPLPSTARLWPLWLAWVLFVVYGSLVPLDFHPLPIDAAWQRLLQAPMLNLGVESRADWVANAVLYLPVGFLTSGLLSGPRAGTARQWLAGVLGLVFGCALAVAVEFAQTAFPPRTVSRNDLLAEGLGTLLGALAAGWGAQPLRRLMAGFGAGHQGLARLLAPAYGLAFVGLALFPFDLVLGADEWAAKLQRGQVAWWLVAGSGDGGGLARRLAKLFVETAAVVPIGLWWSARRRAAGRPAAGAASAHAWVVGLALGLGIELAQLCIVTGLSQGASVLTRAVGFAVGAAALDRVVGAHVEAVRALLRRASAPFLVLYAPLLSVQFGWWQGGWMDPMRALARLQDTRFTPFYYHYFTSEAQALVSLVAVVCAYAPVGVLGWAWHLGPGITALVAGLLAATIEAGRLMVASTKPDPSNVWLAAAAAWAVHRLSLRLGSTPAPAPGPER